MNSPNPKINLRPPCLLIIDDDSSVRESYRQMLNNEYRIVEAGGVDDGLSLINREHPDLVTLDIRMPGKDGMEGLRLIRKQNKALPVILITGFGTIDTACEALRLGASDYLQKPCDYARLTETIRHHLQKKPLREEPASAIAGEMTKNHFRVRIEFHLGEARDYQKLNHAMYQYGLSSFILRPNGSSYCLPSGEYYYDGEQTGAKVLALAKAAARTIGLEFSVFITEAKGHYTTNLKIAAPLNAKPLSKFKKIRHAHAERLRKNNQLTQTF